MKQSVFESQRSLWLLALAFLLVWLYMLGARTLVPTDEGRYAEMAREMLATGDWITLRLNGIKYFEKPPLQNWMNALTFAAFGLGDWQARLWTGLCGLLGVVAVGYTGARLYDRRLGWIAACVLGSSFYWAGMGHVNSLDMGLSGMTTITLCGLLLAQQPGASERQQRNAMLWCWAGMALATLSKGLIGFVLPGAVLVLYTLWTRDWQLWTRLHMGKGLLLFFAITTPWFVLIAMRNPEHPHFFFIHEHFQRFTSTVHKRGGAWYYFFPFLILGIVPWLGSLLQGIRQGFSSPPGTERRFQPEKMLLIWSVFFFFFFSISGSKLPGYILPIFPSLALLIAVHLHQAGASSLRIAAGVQALIGMAGLIALPLIVPGQVAKADAFDAPLLQHYQPWLMAAAAIALLGAMASWWLARRQQNGRDLAIVLLSFSGYLAGQVAFLGHDAWGKYIAGSAYVPAIQAELVTPDTPIYAVGRYEQALPFYLQRTTKLVEFPDEMQFGLEQQPELWLPRREDFVREWRLHASKGEHAVAIVRNDIYDDLLNQQLPMRLIAKDPRRTIIALPLNGNGKGNGTGSGKP